MTVTNERLTGKRTNPFPMKDPLFVPRERYYDREFFELEKEHLWRRTRQMACRLEEIPESRGLHRIRHLRSVDHRRA